MAININHKANRPRIVPASFSDHSPRYGFNFDPKVRPTTVKTKAWHAINMTVSVTGIPIRPIEKPMANSSKLMLMAVKINVHPTKSCSNRFFSSSSLSKTRSHTATPNNRMPPVRDAQFPMNVPSPLPINNPTKAMITSALANVVAMRIFPEVR